MRTKHTSVTVRSGDVEVRVHMTVDGCDPNFVCEVASKLLAAVTAISIQYQPKRCAKDIESVFKEAE